MDVHNHLTRSYNMSKIRSKDTKPEIIVRKLCFKLGLRYRINQPLLKIRPDLVFKKYKTVIFVNGCFWHSHKCKLGLVKPKTNASFWEEKRNKTKIRDYKNYRLLKENGWHSLVIWECELKQIEKVQLKLTKHFFSA